MGWIWAARRSLLIGIVLLPVAAAAAAGASRSTRVDILPGAPFPDLEFPALLAPEDYAKLGLARSGGAVRLSEIPGQVLLVEFFNKHCVPCQRQVRYVEEFYQATGGGEPGSEVRVLAIGAGNEARYLPRYRQKRGMTYPVTADPEFDQWRRLGEPGRTPFTVFLVRQGGPWLLSFYSFGVRTTEELLEELAAVRSGETEHLASGAGRAAERHLTMPLNEAQLEALAARLFGRILGEPAGVAVVALGEGERVYRARRGGAPVDLYARVASRAPVCEICHAVHFMFAFDSAGKVRGLEAIHVTKYGNHEWTPAEVAYMESRLLGRGFGELKFDEEVDAVATATMSSALIFDEIRRSVRLLDGLAQAGR